MLLYIPVGRVRRGGCRVFQHARLEGNMEKVVVLGGGGSESEKRHTTGTRGREEGEGGGSAKKNEKTESCSGQFIPIYSKLCHFLKCNAVCTPPLASMPPARTSGHTQIHSHDTQIHSHSHAHIQTNTCSTGGVQPNIAAWIVESGCKKRRPAHCNTL